MDERRDLAEAICDRVFQQGADWAYREDFVQDILAWLDWGGYGPEMRLARLAHGYERYHLAEVQRIRAGGL